MSKSQALFSTYARAPMEFVRGEGVRLFDKNGDAYLDLGAGIAVNVLGHCHPHLVETLKAQAEQLWHTSNLYEIPHQIRLAERLCEATFADRVFFTNSGAEALECSIKTARRYHYSRGDEKRIDIITFKGAFHGRTLATIAAGGQEKYLEGFGPKAPGFVHLPFGDHEALKQAIGETTAAILVEPVQGEGGIRPVPPQCLRGLRELCDENGILLIYDEVQTGVGRSGSLFAHERAATKDKTAEPDIMAIAKGIGGGFPVGACLATEEAASGMVPGTHGTTYGGNPMGMAVANAVLDVVLEDGFLDEVNQKAGFLNQRLGELVASHPGLIEGVRGEGMLLGLKCIVPNTDVVSAFRDEHLLSIPAGDNVVRILPPLTITREEIQEAVAIMDKALTRMSAT